MTTLENSLDLKRRMRAGEVVIGAWMDLVDPCVAEIMGGIGFDWILIDTEHGPIDISTLQTILIGLKGSSAVPFVRVPWNDQVLIKRTLDVGAFGLVVPLVRTAQDVRDAVSYAKYPPLGIRGCAPRRASGYGRIFDQYIEKANDAIIVTVQIEHIDAARNIDEILTVPGLDGIFIGPLDLANSMGYVGRPYAPEVQEVVDEVIHKACAAGVCPGYAASGDAAQVSAWTKKGIQFLPVGADRGFMAQMAARMLSEVREKVAQQGTASA